MCTGISPTLLWYRVLGTMYVIGALAWMFLWVTSNDGIYAQHSALLAIQFIYAGIIMGIWITKSVYPDDVEVRDSSGKIIELTINTNRLFIAIFLGGIATIIANVLFAIWSLDILGTKCQNPSVYGCVYEQICLTEQSYLITAIVFVGYLTIVDILALVASMTVLGKSYPSISKQMKLAVE